MDKSIRDIMAGGDTDTLDGKIKYAIAHALNETLIAHGNPQTFVLHPMYGKDITAVRDVVFLLVKNVLDKDAR